MQRNGRVRIRLLNKSETGHEERQEKTKKRDVNPANIIGGKSIGRTMFLTFCTGVRFDERSGGLSLDEWVIAGRCDRANAQKRLRQLFGDNSIVVTETEQVSDYYSVPFDEFITMALNRKHD